MNIRPLESLTKEELIELVKHEREHIADTRKMVPEGFKLVPAEPTDEMKKAGCQVPLNKAARHNACYKAMLAAAPQPDHIPDVTKMVPVAKQSLTFEPTDSEMLDWVVDNWQTVEYTEDKGIFEVWTGTCKYEGKTVREAIIKAMRGEE